MMWKKLQSSCESGACRGLSCEECCFGTRTPLKKVGKKHPRGQSSAVGGLADTITKASRQVINQIVV